MQLIQGKKKNLNLFKIEELIVRENSFITNLFSAMCLPTRTETENVETRTKIIDKHIPKLNNKSRAKSLTELQQRLEAMKGRNKLSYKDKMLKKGIKNKLKKKSKIDERKTQKVLVNVGRVKTEEVKQEVNEKPVKPLFNSDAKMVFSKFDFSDIGKKDHKKHITDPKKLLENLKKQNERIINLKESGEIDKAVKMKEKTAWKNALAKVSGEKVKDDVTLLKKSIKKKDQKHKSSKKKWQARENAVMKSKEEKQQKRQENIDKRKKTKKLTKLKKAAKKGKIIPGF
ncbi:hypothetical protein HHI36_013064 [Cryptolaemus montrouzieri]|uniref:Ribosomal RNA-processing protein 14/surfeit locus protein 6 C-terminal domain-containing protein n=1 Tax=Cryptolaemus montrouzieri TaxID=559131 RepID=A0ABD2NHE9_9CUCU